MNEDDIIAYLMSVAGWQPTPPPPIGDDGGLSNTDVPQSERDSQEEIVRQLRDIEERLRKLERQLGAICRWLSLRNDLRRTGRIQWMRIPGLSSPTGRWIGHTGGE